MLVEGTTAFVSGANRGLGAMIARTLVARGAKTVFGGARDPSEIADSGVTPIALDITDDELVAAAVDRCADVSLLINNAGVAAAGGFLETSLSDARALMEINYVGTLRMCRGFAPVLARNGGGALVNVLSIVSFMSVPGMGPFCVTKAALWSMTNGLRIELRDRGTQVLGVYPAFIDTDMSAGFDVPKLDPRAVAGDIVDALEAGGEELLLGERTKAIKEALPRDLDLIYPELERQARAQLE